MLVKNQVQLITYPDSLGGDLKSLHELLSNQLKGVFKGGIHILPPYPSSGDRGFAPITYLEIDPRFGDWQTLKAIATDHDVMLDLMVNHISRQSVYFQDYLAKGDQSEYAGLFLTLDKIWSDGQPIDEDVEKIFLRRKFPWSTYPVGPEQENRRMWTTFGKEDPSEQVDLDIHSAKTRDLLFGFLENFSRQSVKTVRLDAVGYVIKKAGTSCFFVEPEIDEFLNWVSETARALNLNLLPEVHSHFSIQYKLAAKGFWIYDFILPYMILEAMITKSGRRLAEYLKVRPHNQITMLDCHDGIPVKPDLDGLVESTDARKVVDHCIRQGANLSLVHSDKHKAADGFDVHQIRCTYYSALSHNDDAYICARAIQFFVPGVPQVYYTGLLAGENDSEAVNRTGEGREINRHNYTLAEVEQSLAKPVVQRLLKLIKLRNEHPAFAGEFTLREISGQQTELSWNNENHFCTLFLNFDEAIAQIEYSDNEQKTKKIIA